MHATSFKCPRCFKICNCTHCCHKRGEKCVSTRGEKADIAPSAYYFESLRKERAKIAASKAKDNTVTIDTNVLPRLLLI